MYLVGALHPNKERARALLDQLVRDGESLITSVEVYQEILHRYSALGRLDAVDEAFNTLDRIAHQVFTYGLSEVRAARALIGSVDGLSARDALHVAVMRRAGANRILSFDSGFDACPGIERLR